MEGIDVSSNQDNINFSQVKASGIEIVYIKATEGITYTNPTLKIFYNNAKAAKLKVGFYHFLRDNDPFLEAEHFLSATNGLIPDCLYAIDVEIALDQTVNKVSSNVRLFANYLIARGKPVCIYSGLYFYRNNLDNSVKNTPLWVASYSNSKPDIASIGWQYSETGSVSGINGNIDLDTFDNGVLINKQIVREVKKVKNLVVAGNCVDKRAAEYLADFLLCPVIDANLPFDYSVVENIYCIGGQPTLPFTSYAKNIIAGSNRFDTCQKVLDFIKAEGK